MTGKKYADQYDHTQLLMAGRGLEQQIDRGRGCHQSMLHAVVALIQQVQERPSGLPGGGSQGYDLSLNRSKELVHEEVEPPPATGDPGRGDAAMKQDAPTPENH